MFLFFRCKFTVIILSMQIKSFNTIKLLHKPQPCPQPSWYHCPCCYKHAIAPVDCYGLFALHHSLYYGACNTISRELQGEMTSGYKVGSYEAGTDVGDMDTESAHARLLCKTFKIVRLETLGG